MRRIEHKQNPSILEIQVRFRNAKGRFCKPHLASYVEFIPHRGRKVLRFEIPKPRVGRKTNKYILEFAKSVVIEEQKRRDSIMMKREREEREALPAQRVSKKPEFPKFTVKKTSTVVASRTLGEDIKIIGYNYIFKSKVPITTTNFHYFADFLEESMIELGKHIFKKDKAWGQLFYAKVFGSGYYMRDRGRKKVKDQIGFSIGRSQIEKAEEISSHIHFTIDKMRQSFMPSLGRGSYVNGYFQHKFENNDYFITGFRLERIERI